MDMEDVMQEVKYNPPYDLRRCIHTRGLSATEANAKSESKASLVKKVISLNTLGFHIQTIPQPFAPQGFPRT